jgi:SOS-response transcriptional repressor LexA
MDNAQIRRRNLQALIAQVGATVVTERLAMSRSQLSQVAGRSPSRAIGVTLARRIEEAFGKSAGWMDVLQEHGNVDELNVRGKARRVPVISLVQAGEPREAMDAFATGAGLEMLDTDLDVGRGAFALEVRGDSMLRPGEPDAGFHEGDHVVIDPDVMPQPGDFVVAKLSGGETTFKKYRPRGLDRNGSQLFELTPLNPDYAPIATNDHDCKIVGTMVEHRRYRRRRR